MLSTSAHHKGDNAPKFPSSTFAVTNSFCNEGESNLFNFCIKICGTPFEPTSEEDLVVLPNFNILSYFLVTFKESGGFLLLF